MQFFPFVSATQEISNAYVGHHIGLVEQIVELSQLALIRSPNHADTRHRNEQSKIPS